MEARTLLNSLCVLPLDIRREWLHDQLVQDFGDRVEVDRYEWPVEYTPYSLFPNTWRYDPTQTVNFCVRFGKNPERVVVGAHYDIVFGVPGANDNTAAVVQVYKAALALLALSEEDHPDVTFVFFDWEEKIGTKYMGSKTYLLTHPAPEHALILDVSGSGELFFSTNQSSQQLLDSYPEIRKHYTPPSDSMNFLQICETGLLCAAPDSELASSGYLPTWSKIHSPQDTPDTVMDSTLREGTAFILEYVHKKSLKKG